MPLSTTDYWYQLLAPHSPLEGKKGPGLMWKRLTAHPEWEQLRDPSGYAPVLYAVLKEPEVLHTVFKKAPTSLQRVDSDGMTCWPYLLKTGALEQSVAHLPNVHARPSVALTVWWEWMKKVPWTCTSTGEGILAQTLLLDTTVHLRLRILYDHLKTLSKEARDDFFGARIHDTHPLPLDSLFARGRGIALYLTEKIRKFNYKGRSGGDILSRCDEEFWKGVKARLSPDAYTALSPLTHHRFSQSLPWKSAEFDSSSLLQEAPARIVKRLIKEKSVAGSDAWQRALLCEVLSAWYAAIPTCYACDPTPTLRRGGCTCTAFWRPLFQTVSTQNKALSHAVCKSVQDNILPSLKGKGPDAVSKKNPASSQDDSEHQLCHNMQALLDAIALEGTLDLAVPRRAARPRV